jgi:hypothetical protein
VQSAGWSTGSEWLGELGSAVRWIEKTNKVAPTIRRGLMRIMDAAHIAWPRI